LKTAHGKLALLAFCLLLAALLFAPMRAGMEDALLISPEALKMSVGGNYQLSCALSSDEADQKIRFESSNPRVASVREDGTVFALASGEAKITARASGGAEASMCVFIDGTPMRELALNVEYLELGKGEFSGLRAIYNSDASDTRLQWVSSDETVAKVSQYGRIEGVGGGECVVSVISPNGLSDSARVLVDVEGTAVHISPNALTLGVGAEVPLKASYLPMDSTDRITTWVSTDTKVAYVDKRNVLHATGVGEAYISVLTEDGATAGMTVSVEKAPGDIQLSPNRATISRGDTLDMQLRFLKADGQPDTSIKHLVVWESSDKSVATVDQNGRVTALKSGDTRITATSDGMVASCRLQVEVFAKEIKLDREEVYLLKEDTAKRIQLKWVIDPVDADDTSVKFTSDNEQVATVSESGLVTMTGGYGTAVITATAASGAQDTFTLHIVTHMPTPEPTAYAAPESAAEPVYGSDILDENGDIGFKDEDFSDEDFAFADEEFYDEMYDGAYTDDEYYDPMYDDGYIADDDIYTGALPGDSGMTVG